MASLDEHSDGITVMAKSRCNLTDMVSASADGELIFWSLPERKALFQINAHESFCRGITFAGNHSLSADTIFVSTGDDQKVCIWSLNAIKNQYKKERQDGAGIENNWNRLLFKNYTPRASYLSKHSVMSCDHHYSEDMFATSGSVVQLWSYERSTPTQTFDTWDTDSVTKLRFNPSETNLLASVCSDRSLIFYDIRGKTALNKVYLKNKSAALCWNP